MPSLKEVRNRISSVKSTQQLTSAMKLVAASKLRRAQNAILKMRPYAMKLRDLLQDLSSSIENSDEHVFSEERELNNVLLIIVTSNKGLCGSFNANVIKAATSHINNNYKNHYREGHLFLFTIGKKAYDFFKKKKYQNLKYDIDLLEDLKFEKVAPIAEELMKEFSEKKYDKIEIIYNRFKNAAVHKLVIEQYLPISTEQEKKKEKHEQQNDYIFEPSKEEIVKELIPKTLKIQLYKALLDSYASEQGARMTAMHNATDNAQELLRELNLKYNKARQASITNELLEIISGAEALKG